MASFDYITNAELRSSFESDYAELRQCLEIGATKAVHVLAGSVVEALLADLLTSLEIATETDAHRISFAEMINRSRDEKLITAIREAELDCGNPSKAFPHFERHPSQEGKLEAISCGRLLARGSWRT